MAHIKNTIICTRPSISVDFPELTDEFKAVCADYYADSENAGKRCFLKREYNVSEDQLTRTIVEIYRDEDARTDFLANSTIAAAINVRDKHCAGNDITLTETLDTNWTP